MKVLTIAQVAHAINAAYCLSLGDASIPTWDEAGDQHQGSLAAGVEMHLANPDATLEQSHESWLAQKLTDGWAYGEVKDAEKKLHPCCMPYAELPAEQKVKDYLFRGVVHALKDLPDAEDVEAAVALALALKPAGKTEKSSDQVLVSGHIAVQYIGRKETYTDHLYGTELSFEKGQVRSLPGDIARKLLRHADMFKEGSVLATIPKPDKSSDEQDDTAKLLDEAGKRQQEERKQEDALLDLKQQVSIMTKDTLCDYALTNYRQKLDKRASVAELRQQVAGMIDQFGAV